jgi:hypothetical protein
MKFPSFECQSSFEPDILNHLYCQGTTALFHNQETALLRMLQTELSSIAGDIETSFW